MLRSNGWVLRAGLSRFRRNLVRARPVRPRWTGCSRFRRGLARCYGHYLHRRGRNTRPTPKAHPVLSLAWLFASSCFLCFRSHSKASASAVCHHDDGTLWPCCRAAGISLSGGPLNYLQSDRPGDVDLGHGQERILIVSSSQNQLREAARGTSTRPSEARCAFGIRPVMMTCLQPSLGSSANPDFWRGGRSPYRCGWVVVGGLGFCKRFVLPVFLTPIFYRWIAVRGRNHPEVRHAG